MRTYLARIFPPLRRLPWSGQWYALSREAAYQLFVILNELMLGAETTLAHFSSGTIRPYEWIPILFGPSAAAILLGCYRGLRRGWRPARAVMTVTLIASIIVGGLGTYFHLARNLRPLAPAGQRISLEILVWGVPVFAPPAFALVGLLGLLTLADRPSAEKDRYYLLLSALGALIAVVSSVLDHLRGGFQNPWLWVPASVGTFATVTALFISFLPRYSRGDLTVYATAMGLLLVTGPLGAWLHLQVNLGPGNAFILERFLRQAPVMAPMVFSNMGLLGLLVLLGQDPQAPRSSDDD